MSVYDGAFYDAQADGSTRSASVILPLVLDLVRPASVVDFGCGVGTWLSVAKGLGIQRVLGLDGAYVDRRALRIAPAEFEPVDLEGDPPVRPGFDLAMSVEVAEHLDVSAAARFVDALTRSSEAVLFGAAVPGQQGVHHVNLQYPSWWAGLFAERGFVALDPIRRAVWARKDVDYHYAQNTLLYVSERRYRAGGLDGRIPAVTDLGALDLVHPAQYRYYLDKYWTGIPGLVRRLRARRLRTAG